MFGASFVGKVETYIVVYSDVMKWFYGGSLAHGKADWFIEGLEVELTLNWH